MYPKIELNLRNIFLYYLFCLLSSIQVVYSDKFIDIKKLNLYDSYFVVLDSGFFLYNFKSSDCSFILGFNSTVYMDSNDKIVLDELHNDKNSFILCLVNQFFFIFNEKNNKTISYKLDFINNDLYVNLLPYKMEGKKISFIIVNHSQSKKLIFYYYDLSYIENINDPKKIEFDEINIKKNIVSCQINSHLSIIKCFYSEYLNSKNYISIITFSINEMEIVKLNKLEEKEQNNINQIKSARSFNNKFFFCYTDNYVPNCLINDYSKNEENYKIGCEITDEYDLNYKTFYFNETGDFMLISKRTLKTTLYNSINDSRIICK